MKPLYNQKEYENSKTSELLPLECYHCQKTFYWIKSQINAVGKTKDRQGKYCSRKCTANSRITIKNVICLQCNKTFQKLPSNINKTPNHFCSRSCACTYHNIHKTHGTRRSKLESYLEEQVRLMYPDLKLICNSKETINSELDFYFPDLKFAIELNGIFHYEPIYGQNKFEKIQNNDKQKFVECNKIGIELCIIDSSSCKHLTQNAKDKYWNIVDTLIKNIKNRI